MPSFITVGRLYYHRSVVTAVPPSRLLYFSDSLQWNMIFPNSCADGWPPSEVTSCRMLSSSASKRCVKSDNGIEGDLTELSSDLEASLLLLPTLIAIWSASPGVVPSSMFALEECADCSHRWLLSGKTGVGGLQSARLSDSRGRLTSSSALSRLRHPIVICQVLFCRDPNVPIRALDYRGTGELMIF
jgi:hypothetical protein